MKIDFLVIPLACGSSRSYSQKREPASLYDLGGRWVCPTADGMRHLGAVGALSVLKGD